METTGNRAVLADPAKAQPTILAAGLTKQYGDLTAVAGIDLRIERGECFGFLGPDFTVVGELLPQLVVPVSA